MIRKLDELVEEWNSLIIDEPYTKVILTSIGGSPIHSGHTKLLTDCKKQVMYYLRKKDREFVEKYFVATDDLILVVLVNSNKFLLNKHGYVFQDENERAEIIDSIQGVDYVFIYDTEDTIEGAIRTLKPDFLCKGGDRTEETMAQVEKDACLEVGCKILYGVGGGKVQSSSTLLNNWRRDRDEQEKYSDAAYDI